MLNNLKTKSMEYKHTFTATIKKGKSLQKELNKLLSKQEIITVVERKKGFTEIHSKSGIEYTTEDILRKGL